MILKMATNRTVSWLRDCVNSWDRFWFTPSQPHVLAILRICTGLMLLYSHLVLATSLTDFLGDNGWINNTTARQLHDGTFGVADMGRSYLWHFSNPLLIWGHHLLTILVTALFAVGALTRITAPAAFFLQLMYLHRLTGTLFGLDQIMTYSAMYLMWSPCGSIYSIDAYLRERYRKKRTTNRKIAWLLPEATPSVSATIATRLLQIHLCVIYLFGGLSKARGELWWDGTAVWYAVANYEYQSLDMTWLANYPRVFSALTHITLFWEVFYCALVWPRLTRPFVLAVAVAVHGGIAMFLGMITFGTMMIVANLIFIRPEWITRRHSDSLPSTDEVEAVQSIDSDLDRTSQSLEQERAELDAKKQRLIERTEKLRKRERKVRRAAKKLREKSGSITLDLPEVDDDLSES